MDHSLILSTGAAAVLSSILLQALKNSKWVSFLGDGEQHAKMNALVAVVLAGASSLGIHYNFDATAGTLTITGLHASSIAHGIGQWAIQYAMQHGVYKSTIVPAELAVKNGQLLHQLLELQRTQHLAITSGYKRVMQAKAKPDA